MKRGDREFNFAGFGRFNCDRWDRCYLSLYWPTAHSQGIYGFPSAKSQCMIAIFDRIQPRTEKGPAKTLEPGIQLIARPCPPIPSMGSKLPLAPP